MKPHIIKVALDKEILIEEADNIKEKKDSFLTTLFEGKYVKYVTTFTTKVEHTNIINTPWNYLKREEQILQQLFLLFNISYGKDLLEDCINLKLLSDHPPDIVITKNKSKYEVLSSMGIMVIDKFQQAESISLIRAKPLNYFSTCNNLRYWKIRIEDRYILKNLGTEENIKEFLRAIIKGQHLHQIEIIYSGNDLDYRNLKDKSIISRFEREEIKQLIMRIAHPHKILFLEGAGHDRYVSTNTCLIILGHSILSKNETHITTFPFLSFYNRFFGIDTSIPV